MYANKKAASKRGGFFSFDSLPVGKVSGSSLRSM
jgi:hypothetical protein